MKLYILGAVLIAALSVGIVWLSWPGSSARDAMIRMAQKGATDSEMRKSITDAGNYELDADDVIKLKAGGVSDDVVIEMLHKSKANRATADVAGQGK